MLKPKPSTFAAVIAAYLGSPKFDGLAGASRGAYARYLKIAAHVDSLGSVPVDQMRPALVQAFLDGWAEHPSVQRVARTAIKAVERWAIVRDFLPGAITLGTEVGRSDGGHVPWTDAQVAIAEEHAAAHLARVVTLAANTGQRGSDLVRMRWGDIETAEGVPGIKVVQKKTGLELWVPFTSELQRAIAGWERRPGHILLTRRGLPWSRPHLSEAWLEERARNAALAPLREAGLVMHGLRGTAVVRLRRAGATVPQICDAVGMSDEMVTRYCRFSSQKENALAAIYRLDRTAIERAAERKKK